MTLKILIEHGPKPRKGVGQIVLENFEDIEHARELNWGWAEIARELEVESSGAVRKAYVRIKNRIDSGKLKLKTSGPAPALKGTPLPTGSSNRKPLSKVGEKQKNEKEKGDFDFGSLPQI